MHEHVSQDLKIQIIIDRATDGDCHDVWQWRNDEKTRQMSIVSEEVSWDVHEIWYRNNLQKINSCLYVGKLNPTIKIGLCRFEIDPTKKSAEVSINLNPNFRNKKISTIFLKKVIEIFYEERNIDLTATIKKENIASIKCFSNCGFILQDNNEIYNYYRLPMSKSCEIDNKLKLIDEIEKIRTANNVNWMDLLRLAFTKAPTETKELIRKINSDDNKISALFSKLGE